MSPMIDIVIDEDVYSCVTSYASANGILLGAAVSELLRQCAEQVPDTCALASGRLRVNSRGLLVKASRGRVITPEIVKDSSEDNSD